jgi:hypothetical protein
MRSIASFEVCDCAAIGRILEQTSIVHIDKRGSEDYS